MSGFHGTDLFVSGIFRLTTGITRRHRNDTLKSSKDHLGAPEASTSERCRFSHAYYYIMVELLMKKFVALCLLVMGVGLAYFAITSRQPGEIPTNPFERTPPPLPSHPLMIEEMRKKDYPGSEINIEQALPDGSNYKRYVASYQSEDNKI